MSNLHDSGSGKSLTNATTDKAKQLLEERELSSTLYVHVAKQSACAIRSMRIGGILCGSRSGGER
jgi:hypothetical protein